MIARAVMCMRDHIVFVTCYVTVMILLPCVLDLYSYHKLAVTLVVSQLVCAGYCGSHGKGPLKGEGGTSGRYRDLAKVPPPRCTLIVPARAPHPTFSL